MVADHPLKTFQEALRTRDFTLSAELRLDSRSSAQSIIGEAGVLKGSVDGIQVTDSPGGRVHLSPLVVARILLDQGIDPVLHMSCRDRNRVALRADLLGAVEQGVTSLLLMRGEKFPADYPGEHKAVFDWGIKKLIANARAVRLDPNNPNSPGLFLGSIVTAFNPQRDWQPRKIVARADGGIKFIQTQLCFDVNLVRRYVSSLVAAKLMERVSVVIGIAPIPSAEMGEWLAANLRATVVPVAVIKRLREAADPEHEGAVICAEMLQQLVEIPGVSGANVVSLGKTETVAKAIDLAGLRA